jgi:hypothetical protein
MVSSNCSVLIGSLIPFSNVRVNDERILDDIDPLPFSWLWVFYSTQRRGHMKNRFQLLLILLTIIIVSFPSICFSKVYDVETIGEYVMGDSDTKVEARKIALENAKLLAIEQIGTYLESETIVRDGRISKDEIRTYTSGILKTSVVSEDVSLLDNKTTVLKIKIRSNVDSGILEKKIKEIKGDKKREQQINVLQQENDRLLKELEQLSLQLKNVDKTEDKKLRSKRDDLFDKIEKNQNSIKMTFEKGTLFYLSMKNIDELEGDKKNIDDLFQFMSDKRNITIGKPKVRNNGDKVDLVIDVFYQIDDINTLSKKISLFYKFNTKNSHLGTWSDGSGRMKNWIDFNVLLGTFIGINKDKIKKYFLSKKMYLQIESGKYSVSQELFSTQYGYILYTKFKGELTIKDIPIDESKLITDIDTKIVVK